MKERETNIKKEKKRELRVESGEEKMVKDKNRIPKTERMKGNTIDGRKIMKKRKKRKRRRRKGSNGGEKEQ